MREPDLSGKVAKAWHSQVKPVRPEQEANISSWLINGPFHPAWDWWMVGAVHLRDIPGTPPAHKRYPEATHEIMIASIDPDCCPPDPDEIEKLSFLRPLDLVYQFDGMSDEAVAEVVKLCVVSIAEGIISPDEDFRSTWELILEKTVSHYKEGLH